MEVSARTGFPFGGEIRDGRHVLTLRVYYEDTDFSGVVYHASYLRFMERGRTDYLRLIGADHRALFEAAEREAPGFAFVVRAMTIEFLKPARMDDVLDVTTRPDEVKGASVVLCQQSLERAPLILRTRKQRTQDDGKRGADGKADADHVVDELVWVEGQYRHHCITSTGSRMRRLVPLGAVGQCGQGGEQPR